MTNYNKLQEIVSQLRAPGGCPWDQEQTMQSITGHIIEEAYELVDAINNHHLDAIKEELGDVLLHVAMLSEMARERKAFSIEDVAKSACDKMIRRHPHVFGDTQVKTSEDVKKNWDQIKENEKDSRLFDSIPNALPALMQSQKFQKKAAKKGFDWPDIKGPIDKVHEELQELLDETAQKTPNEEAIRHEAGDLLFSVVNLIRKLGLPAEDVLKECNFRFKDRYYEMEDLATENNLDFNKISLNEKEKLWQKTKQ
ncbi:nucleoside triphosphate pyrophosphohydrolase [Candidatus Marinamargulisbacteria bacterium SCGC AG-439-L15]|nr:nucleoside triphosphate pyrophosphohydrolase [Candidatus Marinamargulisbacteria bacterium SCGC AG-439-L15]